jgi:hypothetical protein
MWKVGLLVTLMVVAGSVLVLRGVGAPTPVPDIDPTASLPSTSTATKVTSGATGGSDDGPGDGADDSRGNGSGEDARGRDGSGSTGIRSGPRTGSAEVEPSDPGGRPGGDADDGAHHIEQIRPEPQDMDDGSDDGSDDGDDDGDDD